MLICGHRAFQTDGLRTTGFAGFRDASASNTITFLRLDFRFFTRGFFGTDFLTGFFSGGFAAGMSYTGSGGILPFRRNTGTSDMGTTFPTGQPDFVATDFTKTTRTTGGRALPSTGIAGILSITCCPPAGADSSKT